jgi:hypothetical protein
MISDWGKRIESAARRCPEILDLGVLQAGDTLVSVGRATAQIATIRQRKSIEKERMKTAKVSLTDPM